MSSSSDLAAIQQIAAAGNALLAEIATSGEVPTARRIGRWREQHGTDVALWLSRFVGVQAKAGEKLGPGLWLATERSVQQATDRITARYKALRFPQDRACHDLCCGIGGDAIALAARTTSLVAVDADPCMAAMAAANLRVAGAGGAAAVLCDDAATLAPRSEDIVHIDPDRRPAGRRTTDPTLYLPSLEVVQRIIAVADGAAVKLAPAAQLPEGWIASAEREWISLGGRVRQQVAWFGCLGAPTGAAGERPAAFGWRRATRLDAHGNALSFSAIDSDAKREVEIANCCGRFLIDLDPAIRAAGLSSMYGWQHGLGALGGPSGFFTTDNPPPHNRLMQSFEVLWQGPADVRGLRRQQRDLGVRIGTIKVRGAAELRPETLLRQLAAGASVTQDATVALLISRVGRQTRAVIARPVAANEECASAASIDRR